MTNSMTVQAVGTIERLCLKQEVCSQCHQTLEVVKDCIVMNECGHMMHEGCFRALDGAKQYQCRSCKGKIKMIYVLNQVQVVQVINDGQSLQSKRISEFEYKIVEYFHQQFSKVDDLQEQIMKKDNEIKSLKDRINVFEKFSDNINIDQSKSQIEKQENGINSTSHQSIKSLFSFKSLREQKKKLVEKQINEDDEDIEEIQNVDLNKTIIDSKGQKKNPFFTSINQIQSESKIYSINNSCSQSDMQTSEEKSSSQQTNDVYIQKNNQFGHQQDSNSSTQLDLYNISTNPFLEDQIQQNTIKVQDKLEFYSNLAGLSPQSNIFNKISPYGCVSQNNIFKKQNNLFEQNNLDYQKSIEFNNKIKLLDYENSLEDQNNQVDQNQIQNKCNWINEYSMSQQQKQNDGLQFSFSNKNQMKSKSPQKFVNNIESQKNTSSQYNINEMKTIIYSQDQINEIKALDYQNSYNNQITTSINNHNDNIQLQDAILSFPKSKNTNQTITTYKQHRSQRQSNPVQNRNLKTKFKNLYSDKKASEKKQFQQKQTFNTCQFTFESPFKTEIIQSLDEENNKNTKNETNQDLLNSSKSSKSQSLSRLSSSRKRDNCSSCSKHNHSQSKSDSKVQPESSSERKIKFANENQIQSLQQIRQKLKIQNQNSDTKMNNDEARLKRDLDLIGKQIGCNLNNTPQLKKQGLNQEKDSSQKKQSITFNKNARRSHPDQKLVNYQNICIKIPKFIAKN